MNFDIKDKKEGNSDERDSRKISEIWCGSGCSAGRYKDAVPLAKALVEVAFHVQR